MYYTLILEMNDGKIVSYSYYTDIVAMREYRSWQESGRCKSGQLCNNYTNSTICSFGF